MLNKEMKVNFAKQHISIHEKERSTRPRKWEMGKERK
jgi:hypothetical protein